MHQSDLLDYVMSTLRQIIRAIDLHSRQLTKRYGLTGPQLLVINEIKRSSKKQISEISKNVSLSQATVTSILDRLCQQGFTVRQRSDQDKRKVNIYLTEKTNKILDQKPSLVQDKFAEQFDKMEDWEKYMLLASLKKLASMMNTSKIQSPSVPENKPLEEELN